MLDLGSTLKVQSGKMNNIIAFSEKKEIAHQAAQWLLRFERDGGLTSQEREELIEWLDQSPLHLEHFERLAGVWSGANVLSHLRVPLPVKESFYTRFVTSFESFKWKGAAIALFVVLALSVVFLHDAIDPARMNGIVQTQIGDQKTLELVDGSILKLNTQSKVRIEYSHDVRNVFLLRGEAHFTVTKDVDRPFRVYAGDGLIHAIGTAFGVYLRNGVVDVTVNEGRVGIASVAEPEEIDNVARSNESKKPLVAKSVTSLGILRAGEAGVIISKLDDNAKLVHRFDQLNQITNVEVANRTSWTNGVLIFSGEPLEDVVKEISRYTNVDIEFSDPAVGQIRIGGNFPVGETDVMFSSLETSFGLQVTRLSQDRVMISSSKKYN